MVALPKLKLRKDKSGFILDETGDKVFAFMSKNPDSFEWDIMHFLGEESTLDENGEVSDYFGNCIPNEEYYAYNIVRAAIQKELGTRDISKIDFSEKMDDFFVGRFKAGGKKFVVGFKFGEDFDSDEIALREDNE